MVRLKLKMDAYRLAAVGICVLSVWLTRVEGSEPTPRSVNVSGVSPQIEPIPAMTDAIFRTQWLPVLKEFCYDCHGPETQEGGIGLHRSVDLDSMRRHFRDWQKVARALRLGNMPPSEAPQPSSDQRRALADAILRVLDEMDCSTIPNPGRVTMRRLNRSEYNNTIRDLLGLDIQPAKDFPADDVGEGFDNIGDVLTLPPLLFEKYLDAAERVAASAIISDPSTLARRQLRQRQELQVEGQASADDEGLYALVSTAALSTSIEFSRDGEYLLRIEAGGDQAGSENVKLALSLGKKQVGIIDVAATKDLLTWYEIRAKVRKGKRKVTFAFINDFFLPDEPDPSRRDRNAYVKSIEVVGPLEIKESDYPDSHHRLVTVRPGSGVSLAQSAQKVLAPIVQRAFRRSAKPDEIAPFVRLVEHTVEAGDSYERGLQNALAAILVTPSFLFRVEGRTSTDRDVVPALTDFELATRLSYFLWSSMPDDELFRLAARHELHQTDVLEKQVRRMLANPKSQALAENFAAQWLNLRLLENHVPDPTLFPQFDAQLRSDMKEETLRFFTAIVKEDRSILDFLQADFTYLNERLSKHYGLADVSGDDFQRVVLRSQHRSGLLTHASILTLTSNPGRTSPVKRGKWILENILGTPPPPPPPNVPLLSETQKVAPDLPLRRQLEVHRENESCAVCHREMDTLGLGFENYDATGRWRDVDGTSPVDPRGVLPDGKTFSSPLELVGLLKQQHAPFVRTLSEKMLTFALGRGLEYFDRCAVDQIVVGLEQNEYRFSALVMGIVQSQPFLLRPSVGNDTEKTHEKAKASQE